MIVRLNEYIEIIDNRKIIWAKGALLNKYECRALVMEEVHPRDRRQIIKIEVEGSDVNERKNLLLDIRAELDKIHQRSFPKLKVSQKIFCNCSECVKKPQPYEHDLDELENLKAKGALSSQCRKSGELVRITQLFNGVFTNVLTNSPNPLAKKNDDTKKIFFCYSKHDKAYLDEFKKHLTPLQRNRKIDIFNEDNILPCEEWDEAIKTDLANADIIILLVSVNLLVLDYLWELEIMQAIKRHGNKEAIVIPVILDYCDWKDMPFGKLNGLPSKGKPIKAYNTQIKAWFKVTKHIKRLITNNY